MHPPSSKLNKAPVIPNRFLRWNYAAKTGGQYLRRFTRRRSRMASPRIGDYSLGSEVQNQLSAAALTMPSVELRPWLPAGFIPVGIATGDFNRDGKMDWVVANAGDNNLWLYFGRGDGTADLPIIIPLPGKTPVWIAAADLRANGITDLIVAEADNGTIGVLPGKGDGTFSPEQDYFVPGAPTFVVTGDFNRDGKVDVLAALSGSSDIFAMLPGTGTGSLGSVVVSPVNAPISPLVVWLSVGDINRDGIPDAVFKESASGDVLAFLGKGDGSFAYKTTITADVGQVGLAYLTAEVGDINEDGCPDVITSDSFALAQTFIGSCDGTFSAPQPFFPLGDIGTSLLLKDLNGDGHLDIISGGLFVSDLSLYGDVAGNLLSVLLGDGTGHFGQAQVYRGQPSMVALSLADLNGDGHLDVVSANQDDDSTTVFLNTGNAGFGPPRGYAIGYDFGIVNSPMSGPIQKDVNGDGRPDVVLLETPKFSGGNYALVTLINQGGGNYAAPARYDVFPDTYYVPGDFVLADFRNTGHPDFVGIGYAPQFAFLSFARNNGDGTFAPAVITNPPGASGILAVGDFNRDGKLDFVTSGAGSGSNLQGLHMFLGKGDGTFTPLPVLTYGGAQDRWPVSIYAGDFNHDGKLDVIVRLYVNVVNSGVNGVFEFIGNGDGTFQQPIVLFNNSDPITVADVNGDQMPDMVVCSDPFDEPISGNQQPIVSIYLGQLSGQFVRADTYKPYAQSIADISWRGTANGGGGGQCAVADFNGDGILDIGVFQKWAFAYPRDTFVQFMVGNGDGSFTPTFDLYPFDKSSLPQFALPLSSDGHADLVEMDKYSSSLNYIPTGTALPFQIALVSDPVIGNVGHLQITLNAASTSDTSIALSSSDTNIVVPAAITVPAGSVSKTVAFTISAAFNQHKVFAIEGNLGGQTARAYGTKLTTGQGFTMGLSYPTIELSPGGTGVDIISIGTVGGYATTATFSCSGLPTDASCVFKPSDVYLGISSHSLVDVKILTQPSVALGTYHFQVVASDGAITVSAPATLIISLPPPPDLQAYIQSAGDALVVGWPFTIYLNATNKVFVSAPDAKISFQLAGPAKAVSAKTPLGTCDIQAGVCNLGTLSPGGSVVASIDVLATSSGTISVSEIVSDSVPDPTPSDNTSTLDLHARDFGMSVDPSSASVNPGQTAKYNLTLSSINGFLGTLDLSCTGVPSGSMCNLSNSTVSLYGGDSVLVTVRVPTFAASSASVSSNHAGSGRSWMYWALVAFVGFIGLSLIPVRRTTLLLATVIFAVAFESCGGGGTGGGPPNPSPGTQAGLYTLKLTAKTGPAQHTTTVELKVN